MALITDLMGVGLPAEAAGRLGYNTAAAVSAAGSTSADATTLKKSQNFVNLTATGADGVKLPSDAELLRPYVIYNSSGSTGLVYPPTSGTLNGGTATTGTLSLATLKVAIFWRISTNAWAYILTA